MEIKGYCKEKDLDFENSKDYLYGKMGEKLANNIFEGNHSIEVKTERNKWKETGNIAIEWKSREKLSGISTTKSEIWVHWLFINKDCKGAYIFKVDLLQKYLRKNWNNLRKTKGGDDNTSDLILLNKREIEEIYKEK